MKTESSVALSHANFLSRAVFCHYNDKHFLTSGKWTQLDSESMLENETTKEDKKRTDGKEESREPVVETMKLPGEMLEALKQMTQVTNSV